MCYIHRYIHVEEIISVKYVCMIDVMYVYCEWVLIDHNILNKTLYVFPKLAIIK